MNTPEEESKLLPNSHEVNHYKYLRQKVKAYRNFEINDVVIDMETSIKYRITYIDPDFRLIYGRRICMSGSLAKNIIHITGLLSTFEQDPDQIDALLLGIEYDPAAKSKRIMKLKSDAYAQRVKQRKKVSRDLDKSYDWCQKHLSVGQIIWITDNKEEDREADLYKWKVWKLGEKLELIEVMSGGILTLKYEDLWLHNFYLTQPVVYREDI